MIGLIKGFFSSAPNTKVGGSNDFSDFFSKPAVDKAKVIRQVLREANAEQRKVVEAYRVKNT